MPGYGLPPARSRKGLLPWKWAVERLEKRRDYFLATTRPDGRPHVMPVWGVWLHDHFYFSTGRHTRKARNLAGNPHCVLCLEEGNETVAVEGLATLVRDRAASRRVAPLYKAKYDMTVDEAEGPLYVIRPRVAFGLIESEEFAATATRWRFAR
jgi:PPOX class probable F420-dependent enzyme